MSGEARPTVLHLLPFTGGGGAELQSLATLAELARTGQPVELAFFRPGVLHERFASLDVPLTRVPPRTILTLDWPRVLDLRRRFRDNQPAILHCWLYEANVVGLLAARGWPGTRVIVTERAGAEYVRSKVRLAMQKALYPRADLGLANSAAGASHLVGRGMAPDRVLDLANIVAPERVALTRSRAQVRSAFVTPDDAPVVAMIARADPPKDHGTLLSAFASVQRAQPRAVLWLVGASRAELAGIGIAASEGVVVRGWDEHPADVMAAADVVAVSSWTEGHAGAADEALLLGRPVATTDVGGHAELVRQAGGRVVPRREPQQLGEAILALLDAPPDPASVRAAVEPVLDPVLGVARLQGLYEELLAGA